MLREADEARLEACGFCGGRLVPIASPSPRREKAGLLGELSDELHAARMSPLLFRMFLLTSARNRKRNDFRFG